MTCYLCEKIKKTWNIVIGFSAVVRIIIITGFLLFVGLCVLSRYFIKDGETFYKYIDIYVSVLGTLTIPVVIWWLSSYRAMKVEKEQMQIEILNLLYADLYSTSGDMLCIMTLIEEQEKIINKGKSIIIKECEIVNLSEYIDIAKNIDTCPFIVLDIEYNVNDLLYISYTKIDVFLALYELKKSSLTLDKYIALYRDNIKYNMDKASEILSNSKSKETSVLCERRHLELVEGELSNLKKLAKILNEDLKKSAEGVYNFCKDTYGNKVKAWSKENFDKLMNEIRHNKQR